MMQEQTVQAAIDLNSKVLMPVHWGKFALAFHAWDKPVIRVTAEALKQNVLVATPRIGEQLLIGKNLHTAHWWHQGI